MADFELVRAVALITLSLYSSIPIEPLSLPYTAARRPMPADLDQLLKSVCDEQSFIRFLEALGSDFAQERLLEKTSPSSPYGSGALGWVNVSVDAFFDAATSWATASTKCSPTDAPVSNAWQRCASILLAGKFYE
jgi:hypothetical protein